MKTLLAIAVTAAMVAPAAVQAAGHSKASGIQIKGEIVMEQVLSGNNHTVQTNTGEVVMFGTVPLFSGAVGTYGQKIKFMSAADGGLSNGGGSVGIKAGAHHFQAGAVKNPMDKNDGIHGLVKDESGSDGSGSQSLNYTGSFGAMGVNLQYRPDTADVVNNTEATGQIGLTYKAGKLNAGLAYSDTSTASDDQTRLSASYALSSALKLGFQFAQQENGGDDITLGGAYTFGNNTIAASIGNNDAAGRGDHNGLKYTRKLGASSSAWLKTTQGSAVGDARSTVMGFGHSF